MKNKMKTLIALTLAVLTTAGVWADDYNPPNPPDPLTRYRVTVTTEPAEAGYTSGGGLYYSGQAVRLSTSARTNYTFLYWKQDGNRLADGNSQYYNYTMGTEKTTFTAVYAYEPPNPAEPVAPNDYRLYLENNADDCCTFNLTSGLRHEADSYVRVAAVNVSPGFEFQGWFANGQKVSSALSFNYLMPANDVTLIARFVYNPVSPADPASSGSQQSVDNGRLGDLNGDAVTNVSDAVQLVNHYLNNTTGELPASVADVNRDGQINVADAVEIVNRYLNNQ